MHIHDVPEIEAVRIFGGSPVNDESSPWRGPFYFVEGWAVDVGGRRWDWEAWSLESWLEDWGPAGSDREDLIPVKIPRYGNAWLCPSPESNFNALVVDGLVELPLLEALKLAPADVRAVVFSPYSFGFEEELFGEDHFG